MYYLSTHHGDGRCLSVILVATHLAENLDTGELDEEMETSATGGGYGS